GAPGDDDAAAPALAGAGLLLPALARGRRLRPLLRRMLPVRCTRAAPVVQPLRGRDALPGLPAARFGEPATGDCAGAGGAAVRRLGADRESRGAPPQGGHEPGLGLPPMAPRTQPALA